MNVTKTNKCCEKKVHKSQLLPAGRTCNILGVHIAVTNIHSVMHELTTHLESYRGGYVCVSNVHTTVMAHDNPMYCKVQNESIMAVPDGKPLVFVCHRKGHPEAERVAGPDLMPALLRLSEKKGYRHFFYGSTQETILQLEENLHERYPKLEIAGMYSPPFRPLSREEDAAIVDQINETAPDFIWVGLGAPKQEDWMYDHRGRIKGVMLGVGAAFDFSAGTAKRAPRWMQECYMEWLYRLMQDPKRLFHRYFTTNVRFVFLNLFHR